MADIIRKGERVYAQGGEEFGIATGKWHHCRLHGCTGARITVRWSDGKITYPCTKGMSIREDGCYQIYG